MAAIATLPVLLATGIHSARPAASAVGKGGLYSCTTHSLIYQTDGSSWTTWATFSAGFTDPMTTRGDIIVRNASNVTDRLGIGSTGKVLSSNGTDISWQTPSGGGGAPVLEQHTASSSATLDFTTFISSTYDDYMFEFINVLPATSGANFLARIGTGGGPTYDTGTNYGWSDSYAYISAGGGEGAGSATAIQISGSVGSTTSHIGVSGSCRLIDPQNTTYYKAMVGTIMNDHSSVGIIVRTFQGLNTGATALTAIRFLYSSGNIASGIIRVYGIAKS